MKIIYVSHSSSFDFKKELYEPLKKLKNCKLILPHKIKARKSKNAIRKCSLMIAEVSHPSHGVGIEISWADSFGIPIIFIYKRGSKISSSLKFVSKKFVEYEKVDDIIPKLQKLV